MATPVSAERGAVDGQRKRAAEIAAAVRAMALRYGLTPAETGLLHELANGRSLTDAARHLNRAQNTVRNQLQAIFAKTGTHRQAELVAKTLR
jgi:DNA-binding CsgD family transcriptional regulator